MPYMPPPSLFAGTTQQQENIPLYGTGEWWNQPTTNLNALAAQYFPNTMAANAAASANTKNFASSAPNPYSQNLPRGFTFTPTSSPGTFYSGSTIRQISNQAQPRPSLPPGTVPYKQLAELVNAFMTQQAAAPFIANLPGYTGLTQQRSANIGSQLAGQVSPSTTNLLAQRGAERGISVGAGGPNAAASWLAALGLTSEALQQKGQENLSQAIADTPVPEIWNPMSLYVPEYLANLELEQATGAGRAPTTPNTPAWRAYNAYLDWKNPNRNKQPPIGTIPGWA